MLCCGARRLDLSRPRVMGVINLTPDSFSDGGSLWRDGRPDADRLLRRAEKMVAHGADILDLGGESTRPGARNSSGPRVVSTRSTASEPMVELKSRKNSSVD